MKPRETCEKSKGSKVLEGVHTRIKIAQASCKFRTRSKKIWIPKCHRKSAVADAALPTKRACKIYTDDNLLDADPFPCNSSDENV